jgi:flagellar hook-length control protein FliK
MSVKVKMKGKGFYARFEVSDPAVSTFLSRSFPELQTRLNQIGFQPQLSISVGTTEKMAQALLSEIGEGSESLLNIVI